MNERLSGGGCWNAPKGRRVASNVTLYQAPAVNVSGRPNSSFRRCGRMPFVATSKVRASKQRLPEGRRKMPLNVAVERTRDQTLLG